MTESEVTLYRTGQLLQALGNLREVSQWAVERQAAEMEQNRWAHPEEYEPEVEEEAIVEDVEGEVERNEADDFE